jgi:hypothetical protein
LHGRILGCWNEDPAPTGHAVELLRGSLVYGATGAILETPTGERIELRDGWVYASQNGGWYKLFGALALPDIKMCDAVRLEDRFTDEHLQFD